MNGLDFAAVTAANRLRRVLDAAPRPCRTDPDLFFPVGTGPAYAGQITAAKNMCAACPVHRECLDWALLTGEEHGIWGGLDAEERQAMRRCSVWARRRDRQQDGLAALVEEWLATQPTPTARKSMRAGLTKFTSWCDDDEVDPVDTDADLRRFAGWLADLPVAARTARTAKQAARSWIAFLHGRRREVA